MTTMADSDTMQVNSEAGTMIINDSDDDDADDATMKSRLSSGISSQDKAATIIKNYSQFDKTKCKKNLD